MNGRVVVLDGYFGNPSLPRVQLPDRTEELVGAVSTLGTTQQQFAAAVSMGVVYSAGGDGNIWRHDTRGTTLVAALGNRVLDLVADGTTLYATQDESGRIWRVNARTGEKVNWVGLAATGLALSRDRLTLYAVTLAGALSAINIATGNVVGLGNMGQAGAIGLAHDPGQGLLYTATHGLFASGAPEAVYRTQISTATTTQVIAPGADLPGIWGCALGGKGRYLYLGSLIDQGRVYRWDTQSVGRPTILAGDTTQGRVDGVGQTARLASPIPAYGEGRLVVAHGNDIGGVREIR